MKIDEFIKKVNQNDRMTAETVDSVIAICDDSGHKVFSIPYNATNLLELGFLKGCSYYCFGKSSREYLSALIEEFLHTPIKERFPEKKYWLIANPDAFKAYGTNILKYVNSVSYGINGFSFKFGAPTKYSESELNNIKQACPFIAPAIDEMKKPVEDE